MLAIAPLLKALQPRGRGGRVSYHDHQHGLTGWRRRITPGLAIGRGYFPLDFWPFSARAWRSVQPDLCILMEGERWPEHVHQAMARGVPVLGVNARLSDRSFRRSLRFRFFLRPLTRGITRLLCASKRDEQRFKSLGFSPAQLQTTGNLKLDVTIPVLSAARRGATAWRNSGSAATGFSCWVRPPGAGEEEALLEALKTARARGLPVSLLLVPRHAERREELRVLLEKSGLKFHFRSAGVAPGRVDVAVGDTTGELQKFTQLADVVFVGKSLVSARRRPDAGRGGRSRQAPAARAAHDEFPRDRPHPHRGRRGAEGGDPTPTWSAWRFELLQDTIQRGQLASAARGWADANRGATDRTLTVIRELLAN
ncbi:MAG: glycosyltransferase N-terminal domain-containing protein [Lacunisphaera sp.]